MLNNRVSVCLPLVLRGFDIVRGEALFEKCALGTSLNVSVFIRGNIVVSGDRLKHVLHMYSL